jgi:hypothetical protein
MQAAALCFRQQDFSSHQRTLTAVMGAAGSAQSIAGSSELESMLLSRRETKAIAGSRFNELAFDSLQVSGKVTGAQMIELSKNPHMLAQLAHQTPGDSGPVYGSTFVSSTAAQRDEREASRKKTENPGGNCDGTVAVGMGNYQIFHRPDCTLGSGATGDVVLGRRRSARGCSGSTGACSSRRVVHATGSRPPSSSRRAPKPSSRRPSYTAVGKLCAIKTFDAPDEDALAEFEVEVDVLSRLAKAGTGCPKLLDYTAVDKSASLPDKLHIAMERGIFSLKERVLASTEFASELQGSADDEQDEHGVLAPEMLPSALFRKTWRVKNTGCVAWPGDGTVELVHVCGMHGSPVGVPFAAPGELACVSVDFVAAEEHGEHSSIWSLAAGGTGFGFALCVELCVCISTCECGFSGSWKQVKAHEQDCEQVLFECECGHTGPGKAVAEHEKSCEEALALVATEETAAAVAPGNASFPLGAQVANEKKVSLSSSGPMGASELRHMAIAVLDGLCQLHEIGYVHRDVKPDNVMRFGDERWALIDFGGVAQAKTWMKDGDFAYSLFYMSPELAAALAAWWAEDDDEKASAIGLHATPAMDVYSLGVTFLEAATRGGCDMLRQVYNRFVQEEDAFFSWMTTPQLLEDMLQQRLAQLSDPAMRSFIESMLARDPAVRATVRDCQENPWLRAGGSQGHSAQW